jgi:hypothetical protein
MYIDNKLINSGNLLEDMEPSIIPPKEIIDQTDRKPDNWDDRERYKRRKFEFLNNKFSILEFLIPLLKNPMVRKEFFF